MTQENKFNKRPGSGIKPLGQNLQNELNIPNFSSLKRQFGYYSTLFPLQKEEAVITINKVDSEEV